MIERELKWRIVEQIYAKKDKLTYRKTFSQVETYIKGRSWDRHKTQEIEVSYRSGRGWDPFMILNYKPNGGFDVLQGHRLPTVVQAEQEAKESHEKFQAAVACWEFLKKRENPFADLVDAATSLTQKKGKHD